MHANSQSWCRPEPGSPRFSPRLSCGWQESMYSSHHPLPARVCISRKLDQQWRSQDLNRHSDMGYDILSSNPTATSCSCPSILAFLVSPGPWRYWHTFARVSVNTRGLAEGMDNGRMFVLFHFRPLCLVLKVQLPCVDHQHGSCLQTHPSSSCGSFCCKCVGVYLWLLSVLDRHHFRRSESCLLPFLSRVQTCPRLLK